MLDIKKMREQPDVMRQQLKRKGVEADLNVILEMDERRRELITEVEELKSRRNKVSKEIGIQKKAGGDIEPVKNEMRSIGDRISQMDQEVRDVGDKLRYQLLLLPNTPSDTAPEGADETSNVCVKTVGGKPEFSFEAQPHWTLGESLGLFDLARGAKLSGAGFPLYTGNGSRLQRGLIQFMLDMHTQKHGYTEVLPPFVCNEASMTGTGQLPKMQEDMYHLPEDDLYLIPTAEVPVTNIYREEIIEQPLPICLTAYTPCFRREAGAAGKDTRGLIRVHQFDKVELVKFVEPEDSYDELEKLLVNAEAVLQALGLHYRVLELCAGDLSFAAAKCYDIELWAPGGQTWLEVSSCSNFEDFQARRANIRYRDADGRPGFVHTLNGSGVALPRLVVALLENYQQADGTVLIPDVLQPYMGGMERLTGQDA